MEQSLASPENHVFLKSQGRGLCRGLVCFSSWWWDPQKDPIGVGSAGMQGSTSWLIELGHGRALGWWWGNLGMVFCEGGHTDSWAVVAKARVSCAQKFCGIRIWLC